VVVTASVFPWPGFFGTNGFFGGTVMFEIEVFNPGFALVGTIGGTACTSYISSNTGGDINNNVYGATGAALVAMYNPAYAGTWYFRTKWNNGYSMPTNTIVALLAKR
jgi:hypothetical protein